MSAVNRHRTALALLPGWTFGAALAAVDIAALCLAAKAASITTVAAQAYVLDKAIYLSMPHIVETRGGIYAVLCLFILGMFWQKNLYGRRMPWWSQVQYIGKAVLLAFLLDGFINFALKLYQPRLLILTSWVYAGFFLILLRWIGFRIADRLRLWKLPTVIIGDAPTAIDLLYAFSADVCANHNVHTIFLHGADEQAINPETLPRGLPTLQVEPLPHDFSHYAFHSPGNFYIVCLSGFEGNGHPPVIDVLEAANASYAVVPSISGLGLYQMQPQYFFGHDVLLLRPRGGATTAPQVTKIAKRAMDIGVSGAALLALSPIFALVSLFLKLEGQGGSIFYGGQRMGYRGRFFNCWKFRSMEPNSDHLLQAYLDSDPDAKAHWEEYRKIPNDPRITTRTASFIRKASIDELPQLWNVLRGDMSLVGPRPILEDEKSYFGDALKDYISVRPGLTGLWQVSGRNDTSFARRVYWDKWYIRNWSLWGDIVILIKTPFVLLTGKGAN